MQRSTKWGLASILSMVLAVLFLRMALSIPFGESNLPMLAFSFCAVWGYAFALSAWSEHDKEKGGN